LGNKRNQERLKSTWGRRAESKEIFHSTAGQVAMGSNIIWVILALGRGKEKGIEVVSLKRGKV